MKSTVASAHVSAQPPRRTICRPSSAVMPTKILLLIVPRLTFSEFVFSTPSEPASPCRTLVWAYIDNTPVHVVSDNPRRGRLALTTEEKVFGNRACYHLGIEKVAQTMSVL